MSRVLKTIHITSSNFLGPIPTSIFDEFIPSVVTWKTEVKNVSTRRATEKKKHAEVVETALTY